MALKTVEWEERYVQVNKLTDIDVEFISLVPKGANRIPFQIIKSDTGDTNMNPSMRPDQQIQACIYKALAKIEEIRNGKSGGQPVSAHTTKLQTINQSIREDSAQTLQRLKSEFAELGNKIDLLAANAQKRGQTPVEKRDPTSWGGASFAGLFPQGFSAVLVKTDSVEKSDEPVELPKSRFSFGDSTPLQLKKTDESPELPKSKFSFGD